MLSNKWSDFAKEYFEVIHFISRNLYEMTSIDSPCPSDLASKDAQKGAKLTF